MNFDSAKKLLSLCEQHNAPISEIMIRRETAISGRTRAQIQAAMAKSLAIMMDSAHQALCQELKPMGGLIGGEARRLETRRAHHSPVCGGLMSKAIGYAMGVAEVNTSMGLIVAAPTAGSAGVIPGVLAALSEEFGFEKPELLAALFNAGAIGYLITRNATVAGAEGGCQAEVGAASAMAAAAVVELMKGTPAQCLDAAALALSNLMGLICDPVCGLVETPCQKRNAIGASNALISAEMALAGVGLGIPFDETVDAMYAVGRSMPSELRETALGGIASSPTACALCSRRSIGA
jgi:L-serine dehydratase